jgi:hypothetical protein
MQKNTSSTVDIKFILITEELSFIPDNILNCCEVIHIARPTKIMYTNCLKEKLPNKLQLENITNIKILHNYNQELMIQYKIITNKIIENILNYKEIEFLKFRDILYDIFIYNLDVSDCIWFILSTLVEQKKIKRNQLSQIMIKTFCFFQYYNNNYRPIYHLENYLYFIIQLVHDL